MHVLKNKRIAVVIIAIVLAIGVYAVIISHAATPFVTSEAENGQLSGTATNQTSSSASNNAYIQFGTIPTSTYGIAQVVDSMTAANPVLPYSSGQVPYYSWYNGPLYNGLAPSSYTAFTSWGWIWGNAAYGVPTIPANVSIQIRHMIGALYLKSENKWVTGIATDSFYAQLDSNATGSETSDSPTLTTVSSADGGGMSYVPTSSEVLQFYPASGRQGFSAGDVEAAYSEYQARVIMTNPSGPDNRSEAHFVANAGGDWWPTTSSNDASQIENMANAQFKAIPTDGSWQTFSSWSGPTNFTPIWNQNGQGGVYPAGWTIAQLEANPPPINAMGSE
jgi:hypothetical protein